MSIRSRQKCPHSGDQRRKTHPQFQTGRIHACWLRRPQHSTQYTSEDFLNQVKFWGAAPNFAFVAEWFNRTLKEQVFHGQIVRNLEQVWADVTEFKDR